MPVSLGWFRCYGMRCGSNDYYNQPVNLDMQMQVMQLTLERVRTFTEMFLYNKRVVDPYLLAAHGLQLSSKEHEGGQSQRIAACSHPQCSLEIQFDRLDGEEQPKDDIEIAVTDHDLECPFAQNNIPTINHFFFKEVGHALFQASVVNIQKQQKFIQLSPKEIKIALNLPERDNLSLELDQPSELNITLDMFRKLDKRLNGDKLVKVKSVIFLALFGWEFLQNGENQLQCHFCGNVRNVFQFISPSQCTLMSLPNGFEFISSHRPWCCLIQQTRPLWREILKQTVIHRLSAAQGQICKSESQMRCKEIQDNAVRAFTKHYSRWSGLKKRLDEFKTSLDTDYSQTTQPNLQIKSSFSHSIAHLQSVFENCKETVQRFVKRIKLS